MIDTIGLARTAPPVATAAETPQIEIPEPSTAAVLRGRLNNFREMTYTPGQKIKYATIVAAAPARNNSNVNPAILSPNFIDVAAALIGRYPTFTPRNTIAVLIYHSGFAASLKYFANDLKKFPI